jgi:hypothetical protein
LPVEQQLLQENEKTKHQDGGHGDQEPEVAKMRFRILK